MFCRHGSCQILGGLLAFRHQENCLPQRRGPSLPPDSRWHRKPSLEDTGCAWTSPVGSGDKEDGAGQASGSFPRGQHPVPSGGGSGDCPSSSPPASNWLEGVADKLHYWAEDVTVAKAWDLA